MNKYKMIFKHKTEKNKVLVIGNKIINQKLIENK